MACDPTAGFVGELNGKPLCCMTMKNMATAMLSVVLIS